MRVLNWALLFLTFCSLGLSIALADDERMCPREGELDAFPREVLDAVFWEAGGIDHLAMHSEDPRKVSFHTLIVDDQNEGIFGGVEGISIDVFNLTILGRAPAARRLPPMPGDARLISDHINKVQTLERQILARQNSTRGTTIAPQLRVFFIRDGISDQTEIERMIDDLMQRDGSSEADMITIDGCRITRLRKEWEIGSTKMLLPRGNTKKQDLECAVSALLFHYGISNAGYIENMQKVVEVDGGYAANMLENAILSGLYSVDPYFPLFQPGMTRCEFVSRFFN